MMKTNETAHPLLPNLCKHSHSDVASEMTSEAGSTKAERKTIGVLQGPAIAQPGLVEVTCRLSRPTSALG